MAANKLQLQVILSALDKATAPLKRIQGGGIGAGKALKEARDRLKELNAQQKDVSAWRTQRAAAEETQQALGAARERVKQLSREFAATGAPTRQMTQNLQAAVREATNLKRQHSEQQTQLQGLRNKLNAAGISTRQLGQGERDLRTKIAATNAEMTKQEARLKSITAQQKRLAAAKSQYEKTQSLAGSMAGTGAAGLASGTGILYAGARMMAPGVQFDAAMSNVQALTRLQKDDEQLAAMRAQARKLGAETMFSATDAAQGQGYLAMAGFNPKQIMDAMPGMLDMAKAGNLELGETADIGSNILTGMGLQAKDMGRVADILVGTFTRSNTNLQMLGDTMKYVAPVARSVGQDIETVAAMAGKLGDEGIQGSMGGTALRSILNRLSAPPKAAADALDELGISAKDAQGNMRQMPEILTEIYNKTKDMGTADRAGMLKHIAGEEAVSGLQVLVAQAGSGELQKFIGTLREAQGEAAATAKIMGDNLVGDLDELSSAWEDLGIQIQEQQNGPLREIVQGLANVVGAVKAWTVENPELTSQIVKTAAGLGILMAAMGGITLALASILGPFAMMRYGMTLLGIKSLGLVSGLSKLGLVLLTTVLKGLTLSAKGALLLGRTLLTTAITGLRMAITGALTLGRVLLTTLLNGLTVAAKAVLMLGRALLLNPIGLAITLIAGGAYLIYRNWDTVGPYFANLWAEIKQGFSGGISGIAATIINFSPLGLFYRAFAEVLNWLGFELPVRFTEMGGMLLDGLVSGITGKLGAVRDAISSVADSTIGWFKEKLDIHSPSRVFAQLGNFTMQGLGLGLAGGENDVLKQIASTARSITDTGANMLGIGSSLNIDSRPPISAGAGGGMVVQGDTITFNIQATPGTDTAGLQQMINRLLDERERNKASRMRASLRDQE